MGALKWSPESKILAIDTVSQNRLNIIKSDKIPLKLMKFDVNFQKSVLLRPNS